MPRGGSKKGEHRGNAKVRTGMATPNELMRKAVQPRKPETPGKPGPQGQQTQKIEHNILVSQIVHGRKSAYDLTPKEIMLDNMHFFQNNAHIARAMNAFAVQTMPAGEERSQTVRNLEVEEERCRRIASDEARNCAPYVHPRLTAIANLGDRGTEDDIVMALLEDIDRRNREHPMVIEHMPTKRTA